VVLDVAGDSKKSGEIIAMTAKHVTYRRHQARRRGRAGPIRIFDSRFHMPDFRLVSPKSRRRKRMVRRTMRTSPTQSSPSVWCSAKVANRASLGLQGSEVKLEDRREWWSNFSHWTRKR